LFCEYAVGSPNGRRARRELVLKRDALVADLLRQARAAKDTKHMTDEPAELDRHR